jgi:predicted metal-binding membrane protein
MNMAASLSPFSLFLMWAPMMIGMMLPGALITARQPNIKAMLRFSGVYAGAWAAYAMVAALLQWAFSSQILLSDDMALTNHTWAGALLIAVGVYQLTPFVARDLARCHSGTDYTRSCLRCCGPLMLVLFVVGIMNVVWWVALALFVLAEKIAPHGEWLAKAAGVALVCWGVVMLKL